MDAFLFGGDIAKLRVESPSCEVFVVRDGSDCVAHAQHTNRLTPVVGKIYVYALNKRPVSAHVDYEQALSFACKHVEATS